MKKLDDFIDRGNVSSVFVGPSALKSVGGKSRFCTIRDNRGQTIRTGAGDTVEEAILDALRDPREPDTEQPSLPGIVTRNRMPGV